MEGRLRLNATDDDRGVELAAEAESALPYAPSAVLDFDSDLFADDESDGGEQDELDYDWDELPESCGSTPAVTTALAAATAPLRGGDLLDRGDCHDDDDDDDDDVRNQAAIACYGSAPRKTTPVVVARADVQTPIPLSVEDIYRCQCWCCRGSSGLGAFDDDPGAAAIDFGALSDFLEQLRHEQQQRRNDFLEQQRRNRLGFYFNPLRWPRLEDDDWLQPSPQRPAPTQLQPQQPLRAPADPTVAVALPRWRGGEAVLRTWIRRALVAAYLEAALAIGNGTRMASRNADRRAIVDEGQDQDQASGVVAVSERTFILWKGQKQPTIMSGSTTLWGATSTSSAARGAVLSAAG